MPRGLIIEEQPRDIARGNGLIFNEQVHKRFIYPRFAFGFQYPEPTPPGGVADLIYPYKGGGFSPS
jgi:hypothetical protein